MGPMACRPGGDRALALKIGAQSSTCFAPPRPRPGPAKTKASAPAEFKTELQLTRWSGRPDSNWGPLAPKASALPAAPRPDAESIGHRRGLGTVGSGGALSLVSPTSHHSEFAQGAPHPSNSRSVDILDAIIVILVIAVSFSGYRRGLTWGGLSMAGLVIGSVVGALVAPPLTRALSPQPGGANQPLIAAGIFLA